METTMLRRTETSTIRGQPILQLIAITTQNVYVTINHEEQVLSRFLALYAVETWLLGTIHA